MGIPGGLYCFTDKIKLGRLSSNFGSTMVGHSGCLYWFPSGNMCISHGNVVKDLTLYPPVKPTIQQELPLWPDEEDVEQEIETLQLYIIEHSLAAKLPTEDHVLSQFINSSPSGYFMEFLSSVCATQQIDIASSSSMNPNINSKILIDSTIKEVETQ